MEKTMAILEITMLFLGSIIGAGFATGAELMTFFGKFQLPIWFIAIIIGITIFIMITVEILLFYPSQQRCQQLFNHNKYFSIFLDLAFVMIYLILYTAMTAGIFQITNQFTCLVSLFISALVVLYGIYRLTKFNFYIMLITITLIITTALPHLSIKTIDVPAYWHQTPQLFFWTLLYAGLNCFMFPEIIFASAQKHKRHTLLHAGLLTATLITILIMLIMSTIYNTNQQNAVIPLLSAAPNHITMIIILLAILTSQYTALFAIMQRTQKIIPKTKNKPIPALICFCFSLLALLGSFYGFDRIIQFGYPLIGTITCFYLLFSFLMKSWQFFQRRHH